MCTFMCISVFFPMLRCPGAGFFHNLMFLHCGPESAFPRFAHETVGLRRDASPLSFPNSGLRRDPHCPCQKAIHTNILFQNSSRVLPEAVSQGNRAARCAGQKGSRIPRCGINPTYLPARRMHVPYMCVYTYMHTYLHVYYT